MRRRLEYDQDLQNKLKGFNRILVQEGINGQAYDISKPSDPVTPKKRGDDKSGGRKNDKCSAGALCPTNQKPICPYPLHKEKRLRHLSKDCRDCPRDMKDKWSDEIHTPKKDAVKSTTYDVTDGEE